MYIGLHVKCPFFLSDFNETWIFSADFRKRLKYEISWESVQSRCSMRTEGQTDMKSIVAFRNFPKNSQEKSIVAFRNFPKNGQESKFIQSQANHIFIVNQYVWKCGSPNKYPQKFPTKNFNRIYPTVYGIGYWSSLFCVKQPFLGTV